MSKLGVFLLGGTLIVLMGRILKPGLDSLYTIMNGTYNLSVSEQATWRLMPYIIPIILFGILIAFMTGRIGGGSSE